MNWIKNKLIGWWKSQIIVYNPIRDVCQILGESCLVLSSNMDQMTNDGNVTFGRRMKYYVTFGSSPALDDQVCNSEHI